MKRIPTIYRRDPQNSALVMDEINPVCQWVFDGEGMPTRKWDGSAVLISDIGIPFKRYDCKKGRTPPGGFIAADNHDEVTGHWPGWVPITEDPADRWHREAFAALVDRVPGTYELLHPRFQGRDSAHINPEHVELPILVKHGSGSIAGPGPVSFETLNSYFHSIDFEGIVWYHPDGRQAKIKARDFGIKRI